METLRLIAWSIYEISEVERRSLLWSFITSFHGPSITISLIRACHVNIGWKNSIRTGFLMFPMSHQMWAVVATLDVNGTFVHPIAQ